MTASVRSSDKGGPRPQNQRKRAELRKPRRALVAVLAIVATLAIAIGIALVARPDGQLLRLSSDALVGSAFGSFRPSGLLLAILVGGAQAVAAVLLVLHHERGRAGAAVAAGLVIAWSAFQVMVMSRTTWLPPVFFAIGFFELLLLAGSTPRATGKSTRKRRFGQR